MSKKLQDTAYNYGAKTRSRKPVDWKARALKAEAELAKVREALAGILRNHEVVGAGASIFQCTTAEVKAARDAMSVR
jgi:hypothetical protein